MARATTGPYAGDRKPPSQCNAPGDQWAEFALDLSADKRAGDTDQKANKNNAPGDRWPINTIHYIGDKKRHRICESAPSQPVAEQELHEDVRCHHDGGHGDHAGKNAGHGYGPF